VTNTQNHDLISLKIKHDTIVADTKSVCTQLRLLEGFGMRERIGFVAKEGLADALLDTRVERIDISDCTVGVDQPVLHRPKTCP
jgi:hypothetical protein